MIANEMNRTRRLMDEGDTARRRRGYERTLNRPELKPTPPRFPEAAQKIPTSERSPSMNR